MHRSQFLLAQSFAVFNRYFRDAKTFQLHMMIKLYLDVKAFGFHFPVSKNLRTQYAQPCQRIG